MTPPTIYKHADFEAPDWGELGSPPIDALSYRSTVLSHAPLAYWRFGETSGTAAADVSGHHHHATYHGGCALNQPGAVHLDDDPSVYFDGIASWIELPDSLSLAMNDPVTLVFWNHVRNADLQQAASLWIGNQNDPDRCVCHAPWEDRVIYWDYGTKNSQGRIQTSYAAHLDRWTHVALASAGRLGSFKAIYLNGQAAATSNSSDGPTQDIVGGSLRVWPLNTPSLQHAGRLDEVAVFNQVLTASQIKALYRSGVNPWA